MTKSLFPNYAGLISKAIAKADTTEEQLAAVILIDHLEEDYMYMHVRGKEDRIQELRVQLQEKRDEMTRQENPVITRCGTIHHHTRQP
ncbi:MAG: hypothetical protein ACT4OJ_14130 [Bacteroidota bacterium]